MHSMKIAHEAPLSLMPLVKELTDYDYALVHLFDDPDIGFRYRTFFECSLEAGREVILDNSLFELKESFDPRVFFDIIKDLKPTYYIIPDAWHDAEKTVKNLHYWLDYYQRDVPSECKSIGVVQGKTLQEFLWCYRRVAPYVDMVAITFSYPFYKEISGMVDVNYQKMVGRRNLLNILLQRDDIFNPEQPIHLLGCSLPQEFEYYSKDRFPFIRSVDTSNPVLHGLLKIRYQQHGLDDKNDILMADMMKAEADMNQKEIIIRNIFDFRKFCSR